MGTGGRIEEMVYEGFGPGGVGYMITAFSDNRQRTGSEIRFMFDKNGGSLAGPGAVSYMFERAGNDIVVKVPMPVDESVLEKANDLKDLLDELDDVEDVVINGIKI